MLYHYYVPGTMNFKNEEYTRGLGKLYTFDPINDLNVKLDQVGLSSGLAWNLDNTKFYYVDALTYSIVSYDYDMHRGCLS